MKLSSTAWNTKDNPLLMEKHIFYFIFSHFFFRKIDFLPLHFNVYEKNLLQKKKNLKKKQRDNFSTSLIRQICFILKKNQLLRTCRNYINDKTNNSFF